MQRTRTSPLFVAAIGCLLLSISAGCQCTRLTDCAGDIVDDINDHQGCMDKYYCACFDLTRIGHSDWRACRCNRIWCRKCVEKDNCNCDAYHSGEYGPIYPPPETITSPEMTEEPPVPAPEPAELLPPEELE